MDELTFHLGVREEEENVHVDEFMVVSTSSHAEVCQ